MFFKQNTFLSIVEESDQMETNSSQSDSNLEESRIKNGEKSIPFDTKDIESLYQDTEDIEDQDDYVKPGKL